MKTEQKLAIANAIMELEASKGHLKWRATDLAKKAKVARPLIYYHFGNTKKAILESCIRLVTEEFMALGGDRKNSLKDGSFMTSLLKTREMSLRSPALIMFYLKWRTLASPEQKEFMEFEKRYRDKLRTAIGNVAENEIIAIHGLFFGLTTAPFMTLEAVDIGVRIVGEWIAKRRAQTTA